MATPTLPRAFPSSMPPLAAFGMGLSVGAGVALGARLSGSQRRVFVLIGDGESREGQIWEALDFIARPSAQQRLCHLQRQWLGTGQ